MGEIVILRDLVIIFAIAVTVVTLLYRLGIPSIAGFIAAGMLAGPKGLGLIGDAHDVEIMAEVGVVLLLFSIGSEFSLQRLRRLWQPILLGGVLQVGLTSAITFLIALFSGLTWQSSLFVGWMVSLSSTAVVLRGLEKRGEIDAPHGRLTLGILLFQDLSVVPMMFAIPMLVKDDASALGLVYGLLRSLVLLGCVLLAGRLAIPRFLHAIARTRQRELFVLAVLLVCIGTAWVAAASGISLALGAFLAGLLVSDSEYRHQALADLFPFREGFSSLFFISIGMMLVPIGVWNNGFPILLILLSIIAGKMAIVFITGTLMQLPLRVCILAGVSLSQVGEFAFVLTRAVHGTPLFEGVIAENIMAASILSMVVTPFIMLAGPRIAAQAEKIRRIGRRLNLSQSEEPEKEQQVLRDHVIVGGYGYVGQEIIHSLKSLHIPYIAAGLNPDNVRTAMIRSEHVYFGDITSEEVLRDLGAERARALVLVINDPRAVEEAVIAARNLAPNLHITVRSRYRLDVPSLLQSGANEVIPDEVEATAQIVSSLLTRFQAEPDRVEEQCERIRNAEKKNV